MTPRSAWAFAAPVVGLVALASCGGESTSTTTVRFGHAELTTIGNPSGEPYAPGYLLGQKVEVLSPIKLTHLGVNAIEPGPQVVLALYSDASSNPGNLLSWTPPTTMVAGANEIAVTCSVEIAPGTYWVLAEYDADAVIANGAATTEIDHIAHTFGTGLPDPFGVAATYAGATVALYVVGTE